tara:strand:+ start:4437 stop:5171 length:735 start_codon:yes stop_codon:yes gene_type:complete
MISKQTIKFISSLKHAKYRLKYNCFVVEGSHLVTEFINSNFKIHSIYSTQAWSDNNQTDNVFIVNQRELSRISSFKNPSNVLAVIYKKNQEILFNKLIQEKQIILLDSISDPGNLGSIIRTADWFGVKSIFVSMECVDSFNPKVVQATMGSLSRVQIIQVDLEDVLRKIKKKNIICYGASLSGENIYHCKKSKPNAIVFGSESHGISEKIKRLLDKEILIPSKNESIDSLNVSVAFGIILSEFR